MENKYNEWRVLTPVLLASLTILIGVVGWFATDKLGSIESGSSVYAGETPLRR